jgi:hypothetical protein
VLGNAVVAFPFSGIPPDYDITQVQRRQAQLARQEATVKQTYLRHNIRARSICGAAI